MIETGFTFNGKHCESDFGLLFVEDSGGRILSAARTVNEYEIAGGHGTVRFDGESYQPYERRGSLFPLKSPTTEAEAQALMRRVSAWLGGPRGRLVFDHELDKYLIAECIDSMLWSYEAWIDGGLSIVFKVQPFAYNIRESDTTATITTAATAISMAVSSGVPAPLTARITNTGTAPITGVTIDVGGKRWRFAKGMSVAAGGELLITMEHPIGASIIAAGGSTSNALPHAEQFDNIEVQGRIEATVAVTYGSGTRQARVRLSARGRWR